MSGPAIFQRKLEHGLKAANMTVVNIDGILVSNLTAVLDKLTQFGLPFFQTSVKYVRLL